MTLEAKGFFSGKPPRHDPDPRYPKGMDVDSSVPGKPACSITLPQYPAPSTGNWLITCATCGLRCLVSCAGRVDDARTVKVPCKGN